MSELGPSLDRQETLAPQRKHIPCTARLRLLLTVSTLAFIEIVSRPRMYWPVPLRHAEILVGFVSITMKYPNDIQVLGGDAAFSEASKCVP